jgi:FKBP-type peptidyl-prolyl cis-trans isomerase FkpA
MKKRLMFLAAAAIALVSCNGGFKKGDAGLLYNIHVDKDGPSIKDGDFISVNLVAKTDADSVLFSTYDAGHPSYTVVQKSPAKGDIFSGLKMLSEGDSATIKINIDSTIKKGKGAPRPPFKGKYIVYDVKVVKVIPKGNLTDEVFQTKIQDYVKAEADLIKKEEPVKIKKYITDSKLKFTQTPSGLYYIITQPGSGAKPAPGDTVVVNYTVKMLSGKVMESSVRAEAIKAKLPINPMNPYKPIRFAVGVAGMIQGMDQGIQLLNKGAKATLVLPSAIAYGERGNGQIQPFTTLVFDVELVDIIHPDPNAPKPAAPAAVAPPVQQPVKK